MLWFVRLLPRRQLSRWVGSLVHLPLPWPFSEITVRAFAWWYQIRLDEASRPTRQYASIGELFVRELKPGVRPLASSPAVHPADSRINQSGPIQEGWLVQAKGKRYKAQEFLADPNWKEKFQNGYFITYYLCPTDYHRVHSPVRGLIRRVVHIPGDLWPVNDESVGGIPELFIKNERVVVEIATDFGSVAVVFVGATNVGSIELAFDPSIRGNKGQTEIFEKTYSPPREIEQGQELGLFRMGSTVVVLYPEDFTRSYSALLKLGPQVRVNSALV